MIAGVLSLLLLLRFNPATTGGKLVLEDGYDVVTVLDGNKLQDSLGVLHPYSILPVTKKQHPHILLLDSVGSVFYTVPLPISQDRTNHVVRKISPSGETTTIAGGYRGRTGKIDGPAQNASFSSDFELVYIPYNCALLISDRGNSLIRQLNLKHDDCRHESQPGIGVSSVLIIATLSSIVVFIAGFLARPFIAACAGTPRIQQDLESMPNQIGEDSTDELLRHQKRSC